MENQSKNIIYASFYIALGVVLNYATIFLPRMPNGGTIDIGVISIFIASFHLKYKWGITVGVLTWIVGAMFGMNNYIVSFMQTLLDYVFPVIIIGAASLIPGINYKSLHISNLRTGIGIAIFFKYVSHTLAGVYFWFPQGSAAGSMAAWVYSAWTYNLFYNLMTLFIALFAITPIIRALQKVSRTKFLGIK